MLACFQSALVWFPKFLSWHLPELEISDTLGGLVDNYFVLLEPMWYPERIAVEIELVMLTATVL